MYRLRWLSLLACLLPSGASAQQSLAGSITGTVLDASEAGIPKAQISARNLNTGLERTVASGESGIYTIPLLPVGEYVITAKAEGFAESKAGPLRVGVGQLLTVQLKLAVGAVAETVTVSAEVAAIETTRTSVASTVDNSQVSRLGLNGRDFLNFVLLTPAVTRDVRTGDLSFAGQRGTLNNIQVDGADNTNSFFGQALGRTGIGRAPYQFSVDSVEEFQVNTSGYSAEFGRAGGAVVNVVTKSGTNDFHGSAFWFLRDRIMNANTWINNRDGRARQPFHINQFGATLGGPVVKNKDFFFFNYDGQRRRLPNPVFLGVAVPPALNIPANAALIQELNSKLTPYILTFNQDVFLIKNDWHLNDRHRLSVRFNYQKFNSEGAESSGAQRAQEHSGVSKVKTDTVTSSLSSVFTGRLINEFRFQFLRDDEPGEAYTIGPETILRHGGVTVLEFGSSAISPRFTNIKGYYFADNLTLTAGRHTFKAGTEVNHNRIQNLFAGNVRGTYTFSSFEDFFARRPASYLQAFAGPGTTGFLTKPNFTELGFYVQDEFRALARLTLNFGLRYDLALLTAPPVRNPDPQLAAFGVDTSFWKNDKNNFSPRFGFAYRPLNSNKLVVRGGYGFYFGRIPQILVSTAYNQNGISAASVTFTGAALPRYPETLVSRPAGGTQAVPSIFFFDRSYALPLVLQASFGIEYEVRPNTTVGIGYLNVRGVHLSRTRDINLFPAEPVSVNLPGLGSRTLLRHPGPRAPQQFPLRPMSNFARVSGFESGADSFYNGFTLSFKRRLATRYQVTLAYTLSKTIDTVVDFTNVVPFNPIDEPKHAQYGLYPGLDRGPSVNDQRHRVVTSFIWDLDYFRRLANPVARYLLDGWMLTGIILAQTGQPYSNGVGGDPNNDSNGATDRVPQDGRNTNYAPTIANWDLRVGKSIPLYERVKLEIALDAFNAFNHANFLTGDIRNGRFTYVPATNVFAARPDFGTFARQTLDNRVLQVSAKIVF